MTNLTGNTPAAISRRHVELELQALILRHVCAGTITTREAETAAKAALPIVVKTVKDLRMNGRTVAQVTGIFTALAEQATSPARRFAAELYGAIWTGMQADYLATYGREIGA